MTVKQLRKILSGCPDNMEVVFRVEDKAREFDIAEIEDAKVRIVEYREDSGGKVMAKEKCLILTEY